jgi:hypothetical protein
LCRAIPSLLVEGYGEGLTMNMIEADLEIDGIPNAAKVT